MDGKETDFTSDASAVEFTEQTANDKDVDLRSMKQVTFVTKI